MDLRIFVSVALLLACGRPAGEPKYAHNSTQTSDPGPETPTGTAADETVTSTTEGEESSETSSATSEQVDSGSEIGGDLPERCPDADPDDLGPCAYPLPAHIPGPDELESPIDGDGCPRVLCNPHGDQEPCPNGRICYYPECRSSGFGCHPDKDGNSCECGFGFLPDCGGPGWCIPMELWPADETQ